MNSKRPTNDTNGCESAFTLIELLAVLAAIAVLSAFLLSVLAASRPPARAYQCLENQRRLVLAWRLYSDDFNGKIAPTGGSLYTASSPSSPVATNGNWVHGDMSSPPGSTNPALIKVGSLFPYTKSVAIYKCPADPKTAPAGGAQIPTTRSISMNCWLNPFLAWNSQCGVFRSQTDITNPTPANLWVVLDENPASIGDGFFVCDPSNPTKWVDLPATYHAGGSGISFADGHAIIRKWSDPAVLRSSVGNVPPQQIPPTDLQWLQAHSTSLRPR
jgi:prepilin-type N-terminal cleavage/methylation domain-containing protein/prepilin-type processing-associated H-X9-DG protein